MELYEQKYRLFQGKILPQTIMIKIKNDNITLEKKQKVPRESRRLQEARDWFQKWLTS